MEKYRVGIIGATGYVGMELVRLLQSHPGFRLSYLASKTFAGRRYSDVYPAFRGLCDLTLQEASVDTAARTTDLIITALPQGVAGEWVPRLLESGLRVLDHSGDFRFDLAADYEKAYGRPHPCPSYLPHAVYGLPELHRRELRETRLIANPGCYPTCSILALAPLVKSGLVDTGSLIVDAVSGVSGAGRRADAAYSFCELDENFKPYGPVAHRHQPEMVQELGKLSQTPVKLSFTPHLAPMKRGMLVTAYARLIRDEFTLNDKTLPVTNESLQQLYTGFYKYDVFVRTLPFGQLPATAALTGSNYIDIAPVLDSENGLVKVFAALDNLGKGAAAQAIQALNILSGYPETEGLAHTISGI